VVVGLVGPVVVGAAVVGPLVVGAEVVEGGSVVLAAADEVERLAFAATFATLWVGVRGPDETVLAAP
jgi:hypothetical protein